LKFTDYVPLCSLIISITALFYTYKSNTKKYELSNNIRKEILDWYAKTLEILISIRSEINNQQVNSGLKKQQLAKLSSLIEIGRFYFPNVDKADGYGKNEPTAYKGYRNLMLDFLVFSYQLFEREDAYKFTKHAEFLQRHFTSHLFETLNPREFLDDTRKYTRKSFSKDFSYEDFLKHEPDFYKIHVS
jgi:hypothetical protein